MNNNILRAEKVKTRTQITQAAEHNFRLRLQNNIDAGRSHLNQILVNTLGADIKKSSDLQEKLTAFYQGLGVKEKKDNVLMMEFIVSASPEFFENKSKEYVQKWADDQVEFMRKEFGDQLKIAVLHLDEKTPHIHFMISTEIKSVKKYKNQKGEFFKETWSLKADRYNPEFLVGLHDRHAEWNKKYGLTRGVKGSMRKHTTLKEFYDRVEKALNTDYDKRIEKVIDTLETGLIMKKVSVDEVREKFKPMINKLLKQNKALREKFNLDLKQMLADFSVEKAKLEQEKVELERRQIEVDARRDEYREAINKDVAQAKQIEKLNAYVESLQKENSRLKDKYESTNPDLTQSKMKKDNKNGIHI
ncbi:plasmid recombination enzyme [Paraburkholderia eburnea]|uniref:Plasmid recombination enzyme n=1 Tax=Paraburkholderia eburnea TaxID=1189126 RepID=A0A2S4M505_9BURK|nr:MobV family relaxase [Paraburkholderia eburnea]POR49793.1 plasmid recombination enzyme [Paraburkholderia eburnea]PRZ20221.1 plasmid recombination enzyme [Paraburkholderia eburnea]